VKQLLAIQELSQKYPKWKHRDIFRILHKDEIWIAAYENLKGNKGALTPGSAPGTLDGMSLEKLERLKKRVVTEQYTFKPVKLIYIPKPDGRKRPLGLPTANDKVVQEVVRIILEAIYEPVFDTASFGFRRGKGCHDALHHVEQKFRWVDYVIEGDIEQAYPTIDHHILVNIIQKRIEDPRFIRLLWKMLKCGILDHDLVEWSKKGVPQGSIVSPMLANIYYHELDEFIHLLKEQYHTPPAEQSRLKSPAYKRLEHQIQKIHKQMKTHEPQSVERRLLKKELMTLRKERAQTPSLKHKTIRVEYVRYADDWMVGVAGDRRLALQFKQQISQFMEHTLGQKLHPTKTKVTDLRKGNASFLGYEIFLPRNRPISRYQGTGVRTIRRGQPELRFDIPVREVIQRYAERGYVKKLSNNHVRPISRASYAVLEDHVIVSHYRSLWLGLLQYYQGCTNRGRLQYFHYLLHMSCAMTLGHRHRMSCSKIFRKHGKRLEVPIPQTGKTVSFPYKTTWKRRERKWLRGKDVPLPTYRYVRNLTTRSSLGLPCCICDSEEGPIEMHHVKHVRKNGVRYQGFRQQMALLNRKQVPLCQSCHRKVHAGLYHGPALNILRKNMRKHWVSQDDLPESRMQ
jgi:group II intron reverse transcriptase/maturase